MKLIKICMAAAILVAAAPIAEAAITLPEAPTETFQKRPPPPPDPLHLFHGKRKKVRLHRPPRPGKIRLPKLKLPPPPPHP